MVEISNSEWLKINEIVAYRRTVVRKDITKLRGYENVYTVLDVSGRITLIIKESERRRESGDIVNKSGCCLEHITYGYCMTIVT
jgi:hypothetical protein